MACENILTTMNSYNVSCGSFGLYPSHAADILNSMSKIHFYGLCSEKLNFAAYIEKCVADKDYSVIYKTHTGNYF